MPKKEYIDKDLKNVNVLKEMTTKELEAELEFRRVALEDRKNKIVPHFFVYSEPNGFFDSPIEPVRDESETFKLSYAQLRCRYNSHRYLDIYAAKLTVEEAEKLNERLQGLIGLNVAIRQRATVKNSKGKNKITELFEELVKDHYFKAFGF